MLSFVKKTIAPVMVLCMLATIWIAWHIFLTPLERAPAKSTEVSRTVVELTEGKLTSAGIKLGTVQLRSEPLYATIPGRITYDETRHVEVRVAAAGVITQLLAKPGDAVAKGQLLAIMSSPEVGTARADSLLRSSELEIATAKLRWEESRRAALEKTIASIDARVGSSEIWKATADEQLGSIREKLLSAYSDFLLAESLFAQIKAAADTGALPGRVSQERQSQFESAGSSLQGILEQARHDTQVSYQAAMAATDDARRRYSIAMHQVATLLGNTTQTSLDPPLEYKPDENLSLVDVRSPISGTIERRILSETERAQVGDSLFVLANTSTLWVSAQVRESQWSCLTIKPDDLVRVTLPAFSNEEFTTKVEYLGREVEPTTNSIPLVLSIDNSSGRFRPGLFVRVHLPLGESASRLMIPESAIAQDKGESFVFRPIGTNTFERNNVQIGSLQDGWAEVTQGLEASDQVVVDGTFELKSELLLESEE